MNVQGASAAASPQSGGVASNSKSADELKDEFLTLMVAQIRNQDPLNPMDGSEFVAQLAQLSSVEGIQNMSSLQKQGNIQLDTLQVLQGAMLAGRQVTVPADSITLDAPESVKGTVDVNSSATEVLVVARNAVGDVVQSVNLGPQSKGRVEFELSELDSGAYTIEAISQNGDDIINHSTALTRVVDKVSPSAADGSLRLSINGVGEVSMFDIQEFLGE